MRNRLLPLWLLAATLAGPGAAQDATQPPSSSCDLCHGLERTEFGECVHSRELDCTDCHGGNTKAHQAAEIRALQAGADRQLAEALKARAHDPAAGFVGKPERARIPELCGGCHSDPLRMHDYGLSTDQLAQYRISGHGRAVLERGDLAAAVCTDCHGVHKVLPADDPRAPTARANLPRTCGRCHADAERMKPYALSVDVVERFEASVHGTALLVEDLRGAPSCADCHGSHGATPPGAHSAVQLCGRCHEATVMHYRESPHFESEDMRCGACHEEESPDQRRRSECTTCHGAHDIHRPGTWMYLDEEPGRCGHCHRESDGSQEIAAAILEGRAALEEATAETGRLIAAAKDDGLFLPNEKIYLRESERALVALQPLAHSLDHARISKNVEDGLKRQDRAREQLEKLRNVVRDRRLILVGLSALLLLLAALVALKLRAVRKLS